MPSEIWNGALLLDVSSARISSATSAGQRNTLLESFGRLKSQLKADVDADQCHLRDVAGSEVGR